MTVLAADSLKIKKPAGPRLVSLEAYFRAEEKALERHEYHAGIVIKMPGGTFNHDNLIAKTIAYLTEFVESNDLNFFVNASNTKIRIEDFDKVVYPDALVVAEKPIYFEDRKDCITNPMIIVEVQSKSTGKYDRSEKFDEYRSLPSFKEYVLIYQKKKQVSIHTKQPDGTWILRDYVGEEATAILYALQNCPLSLKRLYRGLEI